MAAKSLDLSKSQIERIDADFCLLTTEQQKFVLSYDELYDFAIRLAHFLDKASDGDQTSNPQLLN